ncbi:hypothetical protein ACS0TY_002930 [Phlomoides rotata]
MVAFSSSEEASRALSELNCKILGGKPLYVTLALRKEDRRAQLQNLEKGINCKLYLRHCRPLGTYHEK